MNNIATLCRWRDWLYRIHVVTGLAAAVWFLLMALSGVLINHQESLGLLDVEISDRYLPDYYRADAGTGTTRLNILITDLHSGRIFGSRGAWVSDVIALFLVISLTSGVASHQLKKRLLATNHKEPARVPRLSDGKQQWEASVPEAVAVPDDSAEPQPRAHRLPNELPTVDSR